MRESEDLMEEAQAVVDARRAGLPATAMSATGARSRTIIKDSLSDFLWKTMKRSPMILPIIMEVEP